MAAAASNRRPTALLVGVFTLRRQASRASGGAGIVGPFDPRFPAQRRGAAPRRTSGAFATGQSERPQTRNSAPIARHAEKRFTAPERAVVAESRAVPGKHQRRLLEAMFGGECGSVRTMMLHRRHRQAALASPTRGRITRMRVADHRLGLHAVQPLQVRDDLRKDMFAAHGSHVADVRREDDAIAPGKRDGRLQVSADCQQWHAHRRRQRHLAGCEAASEPQHARTRANHPHDRIIRGPGDAPVVVQEGIRHLARARSCLIVIA